MSKQQMPSKQNIHVHAQPRSCKTGRAKRQQKPKDTTKTFWYAICLEYDSLVDVEDAELEPNQRVITETKEEISHAD